MKPRVGKEQTRCRVAGVWQSIVLEFFVSFCFKTKRKEAKQKHTDDIDCIYKLVPFKTSP
jgi:hypothetical protein